MIALFDSRRPWSLAAANLLLPDVVGSLRSWCPIPWASADAARRQRVAAASILSSRESEPRRYRRTEAGKSSLHL